MASPELIRRFAKDELEAVREVTAEDMLAEYFYAGTYVHRLEEGGFTHWEANRINDIVRLPIWRKASELGIDVNKLHPY